MNVKTAVFLAASFLACAAGAYDGTQLVYRGRLVKPGSSAVEQCSLEMTFNLYADKNSTTPSWTKTMNGVAVNADGLFQVALSGDGLSEAIRSGKAAWIGVCVAGGNEQYPRQELMASARSDKAERAGALAASPAIDEAEVKRVEASAMTVKTLSADGGISLPGTTAAVRENIHITRTWRAYEVKGGVKFFRPGAPKDLGTKTSEDNGRVSFGTADSNCAAVFTASGTDAMPGLCLMFKKGETVEVPAGSGLAGGKSVKCRVYPIGVE